MILTNPTGVTPRDKLLDTINYLIILGIPFVMFTNLGNVLDKLPFFNKKTTKSTVLGIFIMLIIMGVSISLVDTLKSPEQKQLDSISALESEEAAEVKKVVATIDEKITALGDINTITFDKADTVSSIRKEYEVLTAEQRGLVTKLVVLEEAEKKIKDIMEEAASTIDEKITALGDINTITFDKADTVSSIRKEYEVLTPEQKGLVTEMVALELAEEKIAELQAVADKKIAEEKAIADKKIAEEKAIEDYKNWIDGQFSIWDGSNTYLVKLVKKNLNDPKSFEHVETVYSDKGTYILVKMTYRAKNAFGGLVLQNITAKSDYESQTISVISQND